MPDIKVVILYSQSLFAAGIESRLQSIDRLEVIPVAASEVGALSQIGKFVPDVIIVDAHDSGFMVETTILEILRQNRDIKVFSLDLNSNEVGIYRREGRVVMTSAELVAVINEKRLNSHQSSILDEEDYEKKC